MTLGGRAARACSVWALRLQPESTGTQYVTPAIFGKAGSASRRPWSKVMTLESLSSEDRRSSPGIRGQMGERASSPSAGARGRHLGGGLRSSGVEAARVSRIGKIAKARVLGKSPLGVFLRVNQSIWDRLPRS